MEGTREIVSVSYKNLRDEVKPGNLVLINDGKIVIKVTETTPSEVRGTVLHGGKISNHKGINLPNVNLRMQYMSQQDREDILFGIEHDVDYIAACFADGSAGDVKEVRNLLDQNGGKDIKVIAKIESTQGVENFEEILQIADGIMVARGDMGVEVAYEKLPGIQKRFIRRCVQSGKIVITATQMLESMITSPMPTRAEITDVANAVFDGTSAVMLSGETAAGRYPVEAVEAMARIAVQAEAECRDIRKGSGLARNGQSRCDQCGRSCGLYVGKGYSGGGHHGDYQNRLHRKTYVQIPAVHHAHRRYAIRKNISPAVSGMGRLSDYC